MKFRKQFAPLLALAFSALLTTPALAGVLSEDFSSNPLTHGWKEYGDTNLFQWDSTNQNLHVTWDSSQGNSYLYHPLGTILSRDDTFSLEFDLRVDATRATGAFELSVGLFNLANATSPGFSRDTGDSPNIIELDYFPDGGYGPSLDVTMADRTVTDTNMSDFFFAYDDLALNLGQTCHVLIEHSAGSAAVSAVITTNGAVLTTFTNVYAGPIEDFRLDTVSISSYVSDGGFGDSLLASGVVDNLAVTLPTAPVGLLSGGLVNGTWQCAFAARQGWTYSLQRATDLNSWIKIGSPVAGVDGTLALSDPAPPPLSAFYRIVASKP